MLLVARSDTYLITGDAFAIHLAATLDEIAALYHITLHMAYTHVGYDVTIYKVSQAGTPIINSVLRIHAYFLS